MINISLNNKPPLIQHYDGPYMGIEPTTFALSARRSNQLTELTERVCKNALENVFLINLFKTAQTEKIIELQMIKQLIQILFH